MVMRVSGWHHCWLLRGGRRCFRRLLHVLIFTALCFDTHLLDLLLAVDEQWPEYMYPRLLKPILQHIAIDFLHWRQVQWTRFDLRSIQTVVCWRRLLSRCQHQNDWCGEDQLKFNGTQHKYLIIRLIWKLRQYFKKCPSMVISLWTHRLFNISHTFILQKSITTDGRCIRSNNKSFQRKWTHFVTNLRHLRIEFLGWSIELFNWSTHKVRLVQAKMIHKTLLRAY